MHRVNVENLSMKLLHILIESNTEYEWKLRRGQTSGRPEAVLFRNGKYDAVFAFKNWETGKYVFSSTKISHMNSAGNIAYFGTNEKDFDTFDQLDQFVVKNGMPSIKPFQATLEHDDAMTVHFHSWTDYTMGLPYAFLDKVKAESSSGYDFIRNILKALRSDSKIIEPSKSELIKYFEA